LEVVDKQRNRVSTLQQEYLRLLETHYKAFPTNNLKLDKIQKQFTALQETSKEIKALLLIMKP
jgi:hypothetical protein